jgi:heme-degrading monooxygenase HmoA
MVSEIARLDILAGSQAEFEAAAVRAVPLFTRAAGCRSMRLLHSHEHQDRYWLLVEWDSVAAHEAFRSTPDFAAWRALVGHFFAAAPKVEHGVDIGIGS